MREKEKSLSETLKKIILIFENDTKLYLQGFDMNEMFSIKTNDETRKKHLRNYNKFSVIIKEHIESFESWSAGIPTTT